MIGSIGCGWNPAGNEYPQRRRNRRWRATARFSVSPRAEIPQHQGIGRSVPPPSAVLDENRSQRTDARRAEVLQQLAAGIQHVNGAGAVDAEQVAVPVSVGRRDGQSRDVKDLPVRPEEVAINRRLLHAHDARIAQQQLRVAAPSRSPNSRR